ncbi:MAG: amidohydrolase [Clostridiales bacterium]|nr:amidohydrolase [Clostridiales bacterium]
MIFDFHTHAFTESLAPAALRTLSREGGGLMPHTDGTLKDLKQKRAQAGVDGCAVLMIATKPAQMRRINDWAAENQSPDTPIFGTVHPDAPDALDELERIAELGLKGLKLHPEYQRFYVDEPRALALYRKAARLGLIVTLHAGMDVGFAPPWHNAPDRFLRALGAFDGGPVVMAHLGGYMMWEQVLNTLCGLPVYLDTAYCHSRVIVPIARRIVEKHGARRILFGSDMPWSDVRLELQLIDSLGLSEEEKRRVLGGNAAELLNLHPR